MVTQLGSYSHWPSLRYSIVLLAEDLWRSDGRI